MPSSPSWPEKRRDRLLLTALLLGPLAMGVNTIVGFMVAHWACDTNRKIFSYLVSGIDMVLCTAAFLLALWLYRIYAGADDAMPADGRRNFLAKLGMLTAAFSMLVVIADTLAVVTLHPCD